MPEIRGLEVKELAPDAPIVEPIRLIYSQPKPYAPQPSYIRQNDPIEGFGPGFWSVLVVLLGILFACMFYGCTAGAQEIHQAQIPPEAPLVQRPVMPVQQGFLSSKINRTLVVTDFTVRMADAITTYHDIGSGACKSCYEKELPSGLAKSLPGMVAYSAAVSIGVDLAARFMWTRHHRRIARAILLADIGGDGSAVVGNIHLGAK